MCAFGQDQASRRKAALAASMTAIVAPSILLLNHAGHGASTVSDGAKGLATGFVFGVAILLLVRCRRNPST